MNCRHCKKKLAYIFLDLGFAPPSNSYLSVKDLNKPKIILMPKNYLHLNMLMFLVLLRVG